MQSNEETCTYSRRDTAGEAKLASSIVVGLRVSGTAASIALQGDDSSSTLASVKSAAAASTVAIGTAGAGDELLSGSLAGLGLGSGLGRGSGLTRGSTTFRLWRYSGLGSDSRSDGDRETYRGGDPTGEAEFACGVIVWGSTETTATVTLEGYDRACAFASVESAAARSTIAVGGTRACDELCARLARDDQGRSGGD